MKRSLALTLALSLSLLFAGCPEEEFEGDDPGECADGADNDRDGLFDCEDDDCAASPDCIQATPTPTPDPSPTPQPTPTPTGTPTPTQVSSPTPSPTPTPQDQDGDGFTPAQGDCDDGNAAINPQATDIVGDAIDQNCDGADGFDGDGDGSAAPFSGGDDCDDGNATVFPGGTEVCGDGADNDCNGLADDAVTDVDLDGEIWDACQGGTDCDDADPAVNSAATELPGDGIDNNCDGVVDLLGAVNVVLGINNGVVEQTPGAYRMDMEIIQVFRDATNNEICREAEGFTGILVTQTGLTCPFLGSGTCLATTVGFVSLQNYSNDCGFADVTDPFRPANAIDLFQLAVSMQFSAPIDGTIDLGDAADLGPMGYTVGELITDLDLSAINHQASHSVWVPSSWQGSNILLGISAFNTQTSIENTYMIGENLVYIPWMWNI